MISTKNLIDEIKTAKNPHLLLGHGFSQSLYKTEIEYKDIFKKGYVCNFLLDLQEIKNNHAPEDFFFHMYRASKIMYEIEGQNCDIDKKLLQAFLSNDNNNADELTRRVGEILNCTSKDAEIAFDNTMHIIQCMRKYINTDTISSGLSTVKDILEYIEAFRNSADIGVEYARALISNLSRLRKDNIEIRQKAYKKAIYYLETIYDAMSNVHFDHNIALQLDESIWALTTMSFQSIKDFVGLKDIHNIKCIYFSMHSAWSVAQDIVYELLKILKRDCDQEYNDQILKYDMQKMHFAPDILTYMHQARLLFIIMSGISHFNTDIVASMHLQNYTNIIDCLQDFFKNKQDAEYTTEQDARIYIKNVDEARHLYNIIFMYAKAHALIMGKYQRDNNENYLYEECIDIHVLKKIAKSCMQIINNQNNSNTHDIHSKKQCISHNDKSAQYDTDECDTDEYYIDIIDIQHALRALQDRWHFYDALIKQLHEIHKGISNRAIQAPQDFWGIMESICGRIYTNPSALRYTLGFLVRSIKYAFLNQINKLNFYDSQFYNQATDFLQIFTGHTYSLSFDLQLHRLLRPHDLQYGYDGRSVEQKLLKNDGFHRKCEFTAKRINKRFFQDSDDVNLFYLHGESGIFEHDDEPAHRVEPLFGALHSGSAHLFYYPKCKHYPLCLIGGNSQQKMNGEQDFIFNMHNYRIESSTYMHLCYDKLSNIDDIIVIFGWSMQEADNHIIEAIAKSRVEKVYISHYGDIDSDNNKSLINGSNLLKMRRDAINQSLNREISIDINFFNAEIWDNLYQYI